MMRLLITLTLGISIASCDERSPKSADSFDGTWKLDRYEMYDSLTELWMPDTSRIGYSGFIQYDGIGHMSVQILPADYNNAVVANETDSISLAEMKGVAEYYHSNFVYFASYKVSGDTIEHTILSCTESVNIGNILRRQFIFVGDTLWLMPIPPREKVSRLKWVKQKQD